MVVLALGRRVPGRGLQPLPERWMGFVNWRFLGGPLLWANTLGAKVWGAVLKKHTALQNPFVDVAGAACQWLVLCGSGRRSMQARALHISDANAFLPSQLRLCNRLLSFR